MCDTARYSSGTGVEEAVLLSTRPDQMTTLSQLSKRPAVDIEFQDLAYTVRSSRTGRKTVLNSVSGRFKSGELTAIMGPSGAGKSSLLNILAGYVSNGVTGNIYTNGLPKQAGAFYKLSTYIMQEDLLRPRLSVEETIGFAADLKLGSSISKEQKQAVIEEIISLLGLESCRHTYTENLSGGQRRRVSIGQELVNNPPILFLDEPTTGLDVLTARKCLELLKVLAGQGRTVVCTIHQTSASDFAMFDNIYVMAKGLCTYHGRGQFLVPFLQSLGFDCPTTYNPADYVIEIVNGDYGEYVQLLSDEIRNGKRREVGKSTTRSNSDFSGYSELHKRSSLDLHIPEVKFPTSGFTQFCILTRRSFLQTSRNKIILWLQLIHHILCGSIMGAIYFKIGDDASRPFANVNMNLCVVVFFLYTHMMTHVLKFPAEVRLLQREYFNRWYGLKAYYAAFTISTIPTMIFFSFLFLFPAYFATGQPIEATRFLRFSAVCILFGAVSEAYGVVIGSVFSETGGAVAAPMICAPLLMIAYYGMGFGTEIEPHMFFLMAFSFLRYGLVGACLSIYSHDRPFLKCVTQDFGYCHYQDPQLLLRDLGMQGSSTEKQVGCLILFWVLYKALAYYFLRYRLTFELPKYVSKILHYKRGNNK